MIRLNNKYLILVIVIIVAVIGYYFVKKMNLSNTEKFFESKNNKNVIGAILYGMATEHHFPDELKLSEELEFVQAISDTTFEFISWNIGYVGLGEESDFFYDGGEDVFTS